MCGHGLIGVITTLAYIGRIKPGKHRIETPAGIVTATLNRNGSVSVKNVNSFRKAKSISVEVQGAGTMMGDIAWGGNWFYIIDKHDEQLTLENVERLTAICWRARQAINAQGFREVDHVELFGPSTNAVADSKNFVLCPGKVYDRSACGTGTSAKIACLAADGLLPEGQVWIQESITGTTLEGCYYRRNSRIVPTITGIAYLTGESSLFFDERDPLCFGFGLQVPATTSKEGARPSLLEKRKLRNSGA